MEEEKERHDIESVPIGVQRGIRGRNNNLYQPNINLDSKFDLLTSAIGDNHI